MSADPIAYTITEFCQAHRFKLSKFYALKAEGLGPKVTNIAGTRVIFGSDAADWRQRMARRSESLGGKSR